MEKKLEDSSKHQSLFSTAENIIIRGWEWVKNDRIFIFWTTIPISNYDYYKLDDATLFPYT